MTRDDLLAAIAADVGVTDAEDAIPSVVAFVAAWIREQGTVDGLPADYHQVWPMDELAAKWRRDMTPPKMPVP